MLSHANQIDWAQRYRPQCLEDVVLPASIKRRLIAMRDSEEGPSLLLHGRAGTGKTTVASLITPNHTHQINCALQSGLKDIRELESYSGLTVFGDRRVLLLDEADSLKPEAQRALRGLMEDRSSLAMFVLTTNSPNNLIDPLRSRLYEIDFNILAGNQAMKVSMLSRVNEILANEGVNDLDPNIVRAIVDQRFPDMRRILKDLQYQLLVD